MQGSTMPKRTTNGIEMLADPTRRRIVALIATGTGRPARIADAIGLSRPATSRQLRLLVRAGLLRWTWSALDLRGRFYVVDPRMQGPIIAWLAGVELGRHGPFRSLSWSTPANVAQRATDPPESSAGLE
jgi:Bacterial regulatory protein, arsR family